MSRTGFPQVGLPPRLPDPVKQIAAWDLTSKMISARGCATSHVFANSINWRSGKIIVPFLVTTAQAVAIAIEGQTKFQHLMRSVLRSGLQFREPTGRVGDWGKMPSTSQNISMIFASQLRNRVGANAPGTPLPQSTMIFIGRASLMSSVMRWM